MQQFGLIGFPLGHSFSRKFFSEKFSREGIDAEYLNFELSNIDLLPQLITSHKNLCGLNVTIPYKETVLPYLDELDPEAQAIGAVNVICITRYGGKIHTKGYNTDVIGFRHSIAPLLSPSRSSALILGTGGASKAVQYALTQLGLQCRFVSRTPRPETNDLSYSALEAKLMEAHHVIVNTTPVGMYPHTQECPPLPYSFVSPDHLLFDLIYNPTVTRFMQEAKKQQASTCNGEAMLIGQAVAAWDIWNRQPY